MKRSFIFVLAMLLPELAFAQHGGGIAANFWIVILAPAVIAFIMLGFFEWKVIFFYIAMVTATYVAYGLFVFFFLWETEIDLGILFFIVSNLVLLGFPLAATYGFYKKKKQKSQDR